MDINIFLCKIETHIESCPNNKLYTNVHKTYLYLQFIIIYLNGCKCSTVIQHCNCATLYIITA